MKRQEGNLDASFACKVICSVLHVVQSSPTKFRWIISIKTKLHYYTIVDSLESLLLLCTHLRSRHVNPPQADTPRADTSLGRHPQADIPPRQTPPRQTASRTRPLQWTVRILLECIFVFNIFTSKVPHFV